MPRLKTTIKEAEESVEQLIDNLKPGLKILKKRKSKLQEENEKLPSIIDFEKSPLNKQNKLIPIKKDLLAELANKGLSKKEESQIKNLKFNKDGLKNYLTKKKEIEEKEKNLNESNIDNKEISDKKASAANNKKLAGKTKEANMI